MGIVAGIGAIASVWTGAVAAADAKETAATAAEQQQTALDNQLLALQQQRELGQEQMAIWDSVYGPVERNLSNYYSNLTPKRLETMGHQANAQQFQAMGKQLQASMAQRGISGSGVEGAAMMGMSAQQAMANAQVTQQAPERVAQAQQSFLSRGDALRSVAMGMKGQGLQGQAGAYGNQAAFANQQMLTAQQQEQQAYAGIGQGLGAAAQAYGYSQGQQRKPLAPAGVYHINYLVKGY